jgi:transcriptional regulator with XRE-family HTH domain
MTSSTESPPSHEPVVAANVQALRKSLGLSQTELGTRAGFGEMAVGNIENGKRRVNVDDLYALARALGVTVPQLLAPDAAVDAEASAQQYAITFEAGVTEVVAAHRREVADGWMDFFLDGQLIYSAAVGRVLGVRISRETR